MRYSSLPLLICVLFVLSLSCKESTKRLPVLVQAETLMEEQPDSSLTLLEHVENPEKLSSEQYATWILLLTEAKDKTYAVHASDSLLSIAANYFEKYGDSGRKACVWYYMGCINQDLEQYQDAVRYYQKALIYAKDESLNKRLMLIYNHLSNLYRVQNLYDESLDAGRKAVEYCELAKDSFNLPYILRDVGRAYLCMNQTDSSRIYYDQALSFARLVSDKSEAAILREIGINYKNQGNYGKAVLAIRESIALNSKNVTTSTYLNLGSSFFFLEQYDSASYYLQKSLDSPDIFTKSGSFFYLYKLAVARKDYVSAINYNDQYLTLADSIGTDSQKDEIQKLIRKYEQQEIKREMQVKVFHERIFYAGCILGLVLVLLVGYVLYLKQRWAQELQFRIQDKKLKEEKKLHEQSEEQLLLTKQQLKANEYQLEINSRQLKQNQVELRLKEDKLISAENNLLGYKNELLKKENVIIELKKQVQLLNYNIFTKSNLSDRIKSTFFESNYRDGELSPFKISEMPKLIRDINLYFNNFAVRLQLNFPQLNEKEVNICCLLKVGAKTMNISEIIAMTPNAVTKKKGLILNKMKLTENLSENRLEIFLLNY